MSEATVASATMGVKTWEIHAEIFGWGNTKGAHSVLTVMHTVNYELVSL